MIEKLICITCPMSCRLTMDFDGFSVENIKGNTCKRGEEYARKELLHPTRMLTSTVRVSKAIYNRLPVITSKDIPKDQMFKVMQEIDKVSVEAPVEYNQIVIANVCDLGVDIVASRSMKEIEA